jgi:hypothetical protein
MPRRTKRCLTWEDKNGGLLREAMAQKGLDGIKLQ